MPRPRSSSMLEGIRVDEGLIDTYRRMNPTPIQEANGIRRGDLVKFKRSSRVVERAWGEVVGVVKEIRRGRSSPLVISASGMSNIGSIQNVALIEGKSGTIHFSDTRDLAKVK